MNYVYTSDLVGLLGAHFWILPSYVQNRDRYPLHPLWYDAQIHCDHIESFADSLIRSEYDLPNCPKIITCKNGSLFEQRLFSDWVASPNSKIREAYSKFSFDLFQTLNDVDKNGQGNEEECDRLSVLIRNFVIFTDNWQDPVGPSQRRIFRNTGHWFKIFSASLRWKGFL